MYLVNPQEDGPIKKQKGHARSIGKATTISKVTSVQGNETRGIYYIHTSQYSDLMQKLQNYDASSGVNGVSLNSCLEPGPNMQNLLWSVLIRNRLYPIALCADIKKAFLQIQIKEEDRNVLRFHWIKDLDLNQVVTYRFARALFGDESIALSVARNSERSS